jgi:hypothetical protein
MYSTDQSVEVTARILIPFVADQTFSFILMGEIMLNLCDFAFCDILSGTPVT